MPAHKLLPVCGLQPLALSGLLLLAGCATAQFDALPDEPPRASSYVLPTNTSLATFSDSGIVDPVAVHDLADLIDLAESHDPETRVAWNAAKDAALVAGVARSAYLPRLTASALGGYQSEHGHASALGLGTSPDNSVSGGVSVLSLQWLLFDFGQRRAVVESADLMTHVADVGFTGAHQRLIHAVSLAFYAYAATRARLESAKHSLEDARVVQTAAEQRFGRGIGTVVEIAQARLAAAQANLAEVRARGAVEDSYATLLTAMGLSPLVKIAVADTAGHHLSAALAGDVEGIISASLGRRPDVLAAYSALQASLASERAAKAEFLPKIFLSANTLYANGDLTVTGVPAVTQDQPPTLNLTDRRSSASVMLGITVPVFDGGTRRAALARARTHTQTARVTLERVKNDAVQQIVVANTTLRTSLAAHDAADELRSAAQTTFDAALAAYRNGVGASTEVLIAERQLLEARDAYSDSYSAALSAAATLSLATGALGSSPTERDPP